MCAATERFHVVNATPLQEEHMYLAQRVEDLEQTNARLNEAILFYQMLVDTLPQSICRKDIEGRCVFANEAFLARFGMTLEQALHKTNADFYPPDMAAAYTTDDQQILQTGEVRVTVDMHPVPDTDDQHPVQVIKAPCYDNNGRIVGTQEIVWDITNQYMASYMEQRLHQANEELERCVARQTAELRQSQALNQGILEHMPGIAYVKDVHGRYLMINTYAANLLHRCKDAIIGQTDAELFPAELAARWQAYDQQVLASGQALSYEEVIPALDGPHTYQKVLFPLYDAHGEITAIAGIATDVTAYQHMDGTAAEQHQQPASIPPMTLNNVATPIIPITEHVLMVPLMGTLDSQRVPHIVRAVMEGTAWRRPSVVILDITGVHCIDTSLAQTLTLATRSVRLLGARVMLTGAQTGTTQRLIRLGVDLSHVTLHATLQAGITDALDVPGSAAQDN